MPEPRIVNYGVDTFVMNAYLTQDGERVKCDIDLALAEQLEEWKKAAQAGSEPFPTSWTFNGAPLLMQPNGAGRGQWRWMLKTNDITLYISSGQWNGIASVRCNASYLWSCSCLLEAIYTVDEFLQTIFHVPLFLQPSSVDLCVDVANWHDVTALDRRRNFVSRSRKRATYQESDISLHSDMQLADYSYGLKETGFDFSQRGAMSATIYDKLREIKRSGKEWFADLWHHRAGWDLEREPSVWRVEMKFKRSVLREIKQGTVFHGIENAYDLPELLPVLWAYAVGHIEGGADGLPDGWLRCVVPTDDKNRARWPTHPVWKKVQTAFLEPIDEVPPHFGKIIRQRREERNIKKGLQAMLGYGTSLSAWVGGDLAQPETDFSLFLHWLADEGSKLLDVEDRDFSAEVQRKRLLLGL
jgi:hypothetical protein